MVSSTSTVYNHAASFVCLDPDISGLHPRPVEVNGILLVFPYNDEKSHLTIKLLHLFSIFIYVPITQENPQTCE